MIISFSGPSSAGKSTLLQKCKELYKERFSYKEEITRSIKNKGLPINEQGTDITQLLIINSHIENTLIDNVILDRCILDGLIYTNYLYNQNKVNKKTLDYAEFVYDLLIDKYDIIFYTEPVELIDDGVRSINKEFRDSTIQLFDDKIQRSKRLQRKLIRLSGPVSNRMLIIQSHLN